MLLLASEEISKGFLLSSIVIFQCHFVILQRQMSVPSLFFRGIAFCTEHSALEAVWERCPYTCLASSYFPKTTLLFEVFFSQNTQDVSSTNTKSQESLVSGSCPAVLHLMSICTSSLSAACRQCKAGMV